MKINEIDRETTVQLDSGARCILYFQCTPKVASKVRRAFWSGNVSTSDWVPF